MRPLRLMLLPVTIAVQALMLFTGFVLALWLGMFALRYLLPIAVLVIVLGPIIGALYEYGWHRLTPAGRRDLTYRASVGPTGIRYLASGCALPVAFACIPLVIVAMLAAIIRVGDILGL